jgi:lipoprotein-releasing system permease protein
MGYPLQLTLRYMTSKKGAFISVGTAFATVGVALGVAALATVMSVTGGFQAQFREKVLGVNAHVLVLKHTTDFREYRDVMEKVKNVPGVVAVNPFIINPMMVSHDDKTATGVMVKGVDPDLMPRVLDLPRHVREGSLQGLRREGALPPSRPGEKAPGSPPPPAALPWPPPPHLESAPEARRADDEDDDEAALAPPVIARGAPRGSIQPPGGYKSALPDDDTLPPDVAPDPCSSPEVVAKLPGIAVGTTLAKNLGLAIGSCVQITSPTIGFTFVRGAIRPPVAKQFRVIALFEAGFDQYDSKFVYTDLFEAQSFYDQGDTVMGVEMKVSDINKAGSIAHVIDKMLADGLYQTMDWKELNHGLFTALLLQQISMSFVLALIILVASFTVVATLIMLVLDKKREIAVLKAMGATNGAILRIFMYQGGIIGLVGTTVGLLLGLGVCKGLLAYAFPLDPKVYFISHLPVDVQPWGFAITGGVAVAICLVATVPPALFAAWLRPADGLRGQ